MMSVDTLWQILDALVQPLTSEQVSLLSAQNRVLRQDILSPQDQPPFDRSSIDGYLVRADEKASLLKISGQHQPGLNAPDLPAQGEALRIFTGSSLPAGSALVMQEDVEQEGSDHIRLNKRQVTDLIRYRGSQARTGDLLLASGSVLHAGSLSLLSSVGMTHPWVSRRPRIAHLVTGSELVAPEHTPAAGQIRDSNSTLIEGLVRAAGAELVWQQRVGENSTEASQTLEGAFSLCPDILLISGGASVGDHDHTASLLRKLGFEIQCEKVASRPGKPFIAATRKNQLAFGLPGNPLSHFVCFHLFVRRVINGLLSLPPRSTRQVCLAPHAVVETHPRETWWPCSLDQSRPETIAHPLSWKDSSDLTVLARTDALIRLHSNSAPGPVVEILSCT